MRQDDADCVRLTRTGQLAVAHNRCPVRDRTGAYPNVQLYIMHIIGAQGEGLHRGLTLHGLSLQNTAEQSLWRPVEPMTVVMPSRSRSGISEWSANLTQYGLPTYGGWPATGAPGSATSI